MSFNLTILANISVLVSEVQKNQNWSGLLLNYVNSFGVGLGIDVVVVLRPVGDVKSAARSPPVSSDITSI